MTHGRKAGGRVAAGADGAHGRDGRRGHALAAGGRRHPRRDRRRLHGGSPAGREASSPSGSASTATPCGAPSRRWRPTAWCGPSGAAAPSSTPPQPRLAYSMGARHPLHREHAGAVARPGRTADPRRAGARPMPRWPACSAARVGRLHRLDSLRVADGPPLSVATSWVEAERFPDLARNFAESGSITEALRRGGIADYRRRETRLTAERLSPRGCRPSRRRARRAGPRGARRQRRPRRPPLPGPADALPRRPRGAGFPALSRDPSPPRIGSANTRPAPRLFPQPRPSPLGVEG